MAWSAARVGPDPSGAPPSAPPAAERRKVSGAMSLWDAGAAAAGWNGDNWLRRPSGALSLPSSPFGSMGWLVVDLDQVDHRGDSRRPARQLLGCLPLRGLADLAPEPHPARP